ncbi:RNA polymerase sigma factor [Streptomyces sp. NPDC005017]|uniref:RNA polymerase sigma factor n=1 Tax=Streptomyces sp. NPDC005017 TaxID=3364706 RepID=UPI003673D1DD
MSDEAPERPDEFAAFYRASYGRTLRRLIKKGQISQHDAEDILSIAYAETARQWCNIRDPHGYLWDRVCKRFLDYWRKRKQQGREALCDPSGEISVLPESAASRPEGCVELARLYELIAQLPADDQLLILMDAYGYSKEDQATKLNVSPGAVRVRLCRAKKKLDALVEKDRESR